MAWASGQIASGALDFAPVGQPPRAQKPQAVHAARPGAARDRTASGVR